MKTVSHYSVDFFKPPVVAKPAKQNKLNSLLSQVWNFLSSTDSEPRIQKKFDRFGHAYWRTFDPITNQTRFFETEDEVCQWLEKRYYQA